VPQQHGQGVGTGQHGPGLDAAAELHVQALGGVGGPRRSPGAHRFMVDILNYREDGTQFLNRLRIRPIFDERGEVVDFIGAQNPVA